MTDNTPTFTPSLIEASLDITYTLKTNPQFARQFYRVFREIRRYYPFIEEKVLDHSHVRFIIPGDLPKAIEAKLALYFSFIVARDYPDNPFLDVWINKAKIMEQTERFAADLDLKMSLLIVDRLIKILVNEHFGFNDYVELGDNDGHYNFNCPHCHDYKSLLVSMSKLEERTIKPTLVKFQSNTINKWIHKNDIVILNEFSRRIHQANNDIATDVEELAVVQKLIITFRDARITAGYNLENIMSLLQKQHDLYEKITAVIFPIEGAIYHFCDIHKLPKHI